MCVHVCLHVCLHVYVYVCVRMYATRMTELFLKTFTKEYRGCPCTKMQAAEQQITDLSCVAVYEAEHYCSFMVCLHMNDFSTSCSVQQILRSPFAVTRTLTTEHEVVWPAAIPYFVPSTAHIRTQS